MSNLDEIKVSKKLKNIARELGEYKSQTQYEPSRRHIDAVSESESQTKLELTNRL